MRERRVIANQFDRFITDLSIAFAIHCDENNLTVAEGEMLCEEVYDRIAQSADERTNYLPDDRGTE